MNQVEILLVEDNPTDAEMAIRALRKHNIANHLVHVEDGEKALDFIFAKGEFIKRNKENVPKVILLDLKLPKVSGIDVLKELKSNVLSRHIPVVVLSSSKEEQDIIQSYSLGVNSYIVKPVGIENFVKAVSELGLYWILLNQDPCL